MSRAVAEPSNMQLQCLLAVVDTGSFAASGRRLGLTTSGVSKTVSRLEAGQGVRLLHRSTQNLALTEAGEQVIEAARDAARGTAQPTTAGFSPRADLVPPRRHRFSHTDLFLLLPVFAAAMTRGEGELTP